MRKFTVSTSKGLITTTDFKSACRILEFEMETQKKRKSQSGGGGETDWDKQFKTLLEQYTPKTKEEAMQKKYEGGK